MNSPLVSQTGVSEGGREGGRRKTNRGAELGETLIFFLFLLYIVSPARKVCPYALHLFRITELVTFSAELQSSLLRHETGCQISSHLPRANGGEDETSGNQARKSARGQERNFQIKVLVVCTRTNKICLRRTTKEAPLLCRRSPVSSEHQR